MQSKRILLVDDELLILASLARELADMQFLLTLAGGGEEAVARINSEPFDLVITDLSMPGIGGLEVLQAAKRKNPQTIVIILSGYGNMDSVISAMRLGVDDYLQKPYDIEELLYRMFNCFIKQDLQCKVSIYEQILPVCGYCRKIRDDFHSTDQGGGWYGLEEYFSRVHGLTVSHGCCPECFTREMQGLLSSDKTGHD